jgi:hypothetical protein
MTNTVINFVSRECKTGLHKSCRGRWEGLGFEINCDCTCSHEKNYPALKLVEGPFANVTELIISGGDPKRQLMVK